MTNAITYALCLYIGPPTAVRNLRVTVITSDAITIEWDPPLVGNPVFYYVVEHSDPDDISKYILRTENLIATSYILDRMRSFTTYIIRVSVRNSVSDQDPQNAAQRTVEIDARTKQGRKTCICKIVNCRTIHVLSATHVTLNKSDAS